MNADIEAKLPWLQAIVHQGPTPLFATISGAHLYGFESPDSDYDLRGAFVAPLTDVLRLSEHEETLSILEVRDGLELDWVAHDLTKYVRLMTRKSGDLLEQLYSPLVVHGGPWLEELREIGKGCIQRHLYHHYSRFAAALRKDLDGGKETVKKLLYNYRVLVTGIHVLRSGEVVANLAQLNAEFELAGVDELIARKQDGQEKEPLAPGEAETHRAALDRLTAQLDAAYESSELPDRVQSFDALDDFVVRARMELGRG